MGYEKLIDDSKMPFGKHKGERMEDVPVEYLHWYWHNGSPGNVKEYIAENMDALKHENDDLIWSKA